MRKSRYSNGDTIVARGSVWKVIDRSDDESETVWAVQSADCDRDAIIRYDEIEDVIHPGE